VPLEEVSLQKILVTLLAGALVAAIASPAAALTLTLSQAQLLTIGDATTDFGGNGGIVSRSADGDGVLFELEQSTIDFGKVAARLFANHADLNAYDGFGFHFDIVLAPDPIVSTAYIQRYGAVFQEAVSPDQMQGDSYDVVLDMTGVDYGDVAYLGFQVFAAGGLEEPPAQTILLRVSPLAGAEAFVPGEVVPEPSVLVLLALGGSMTVRRRALRPPPA
jgi:hypothetical protein